MSSSFTPRQVARALEIGESTVKRWCDKGVIPTEHTPGGHRRIPLVGLLNYLRSTQQDVLRPELLGLPANVGSGERTLHRAGSQLAQALLSGDEQQSRRIVADLYLAGHGMSTLCDRVIARAFEEIGHAWACGDAEVFQERRGCLIALRLLDDLRSFVPPPPATAPRAIGGAPTGDVYDLPTNMAELVLREAGWNAASLGNNLPFDTLAAAIREQQPRLFWLSCSHLADEAAFLRDYAQLNKEFCAKVAFVVGGRALSEPLRREMKYAAFCDNTAHLESFARSLMAAPAAR
jgi:excisionase family DNA binding protein